jgi:catechol 2,3-dioxygenase-like lactoylglutathione lyase family enzyme
VIVRDPDGIFVRLTQPDPIPATTAPATANVIGAGFGVTVADTETTLKIYRDGLGFNPQTEDFQVDEVQAGVMGTAGAQFRRTTMLVPGGSFPLEFLEFKGIGRTPVHLAIHDPGASVLRLRVRDIDGIVKALGAAGNPIVSAGGATVSIGRSRAVIVRETNNLFLQPMQTQP